MSEAARCLLLHLRPSAWLSPICIPLSTTFITVAIDQLIYWWFEEVEKAVVLLLYIIAGCFYSGLIAPYCLLAVNKRHSKGCFVPPGGSVFFVALPVSLRPFRWLASFQTHMVDCLNAIWLLFSFLIYRTQLLNLPQRYHLQLYI